jgi:hypothetical protein
MTTKTAAKSAMRTITITWVETAHEVIGERRADLGERPVLREVKTARACVWLNAGTSDDVSRARQYAAREGAIVHTFSTAERDPLARARALALKVA